MGVSGYTGQYILYQKRGHAESSLFGAIYPVHRAMDSKSLELHIRNHRFFFGFFCTMIIIFKCLCLLSYHPHLPKTFLII